MNTYKNSMFISFVNNTMTLDPTRIVGIGDLRLSYLGGAYHFVLPAHPTGFETFAEERNTCYLG